MESSIQFGELSNDEYFKKKILDFSRDVNKAAQVMEEFFTYANYETLSPEDKIRYNLLVGFSVNTFYWMYLKIRGVDISNHEIKHQLNRIKEYMNKSKEVYDKKTIMPRIDQNATKRFVRSGLWTPKSDQLLLVEKNNKVSNKRKRRDIDE